MKVVCFNLKLGDVMSQDLAVIAVISDYSDK